MAERRQQHQGQHLPRARQQRQGQHGPEAPGDRQPIGPPHSRWDCTGGPGTGKTTSVRGIVALLDRMGCTMMLMAPTGRAAKRLGELCGREAQTIHRALGTTWQDEQVVFQRSEKDPLEAEAVIVDEMSMVDLPLMSALLSALKPDCRLVMVGDPDQLPSVGPVNVWAFLCLF